jgi:hypothetical protein
MPETKPHKRHWKGERRTILTRVPTALATTLQEEAQRRGLTMSDLMALAAQELVEPSVS